MKKFINLLCLSLLSATDVHSQVGRFVVISIEDEYKISQHAVQRYLWIVPVDSLTRSNFTLARLFLSGVSEDNVKDCCSFRPMDPAVVGETSNFVIGKERLSLFEHLDQTISAKKVKLQTIRKKWVSGQKEEIKIFATPIEGEFCLCDYHPIGQARTGFKGMVCVPKGSGSHYDKFWTTSEAKQLYQFDFSTLDFDVVPD